MAEFPAHLFQPPGFSRKETLTSRGRINYYESRPDADPTRRTVVFLHGFGGGSSSYEWSKVYPAFSADYRVLAPDLPGWGFSEHRGADYTSGDYRAAIREFIEDHGGGRPVLAVASSLVGALTLWLSTESPELFAGIVATNPSGLSDFGRPYDGRLFAFVGDIPVVNQLVYSQLITTHTSIRAFLKTALFARENRISDEIVDAYYASASSEPDAYYAAYSFLKGNLAFDLAELMPRLSVPTAILWGEKQKYESPAVGQRLASLSPQVKYFESIDDVGLTPQLELPGVTAGAIRRAISAFGDTT